MELVPADEPTEAPGVPAVHAANVGSAPEPVRAGPPPAGAPARRGRARRLRTLP